MIGRAVTAEYLYNRNIDVALFLIYTGTYEELEDDNDHEIGYLKHRPCGFLGPTTTQ